MGLILVHNGNFLVLQQINYEKGGSIMVKEQFGKRKGLFLKTIFILLMLAMTASIAGCSDGNTSSLIGKWVPEGDQYVSSDFIEKRLELFNDGTGIGDGCSLTWTAENSRIIFKLDLGFGYVYNYEISDSTLTLTNEEGKSVKYKKE